MVHNRNDNFSEQTMMKLPLKQNANKKKIIFYKIIMPHSKYLITYSLKYMSFSVIWQQKYFSNTIKLTKKIAY